MFIELVDRLRCPAPHRDSWLVARMDRVENRQIITGVLGCPVCGAEYRIDNGVVEFAAAPPYGAPPADPEIAIGIAAGLGLSAVNTVAVLHGSWGAHAALVRALAPAQLLLLNPPIGVEAGEGVSVLHAEAVPLAAGVIDAAAIDDAATGAVLQGLTRAVKRGGRVMSTHALSAAGDIAEVLATSSMWIGEVRDPGPIVPLRRVPRR